MTLLGFVLLVILGGLTLLFIGWLLIVFSGPFIPRPNPPERIPPPDKEQFMPGIPNVAAIQAKKKLLNQLDEDARTISEGRPNLSPEEILEILYRLKLLAEEIRP